MGYDRFIKLAVNKFSAEDIAKLEEHLYSDTAHIDVYGFNEFIRWGPECIDEIKKLSLLFPYTTFYYVCVGEDLDDNEYNIFHGGCAMPRDGKGVFKLPLNGKVVELTKIVKSHDERDKEESRLGLSSDSDRDYDVEEELYDQLRKERVKLIDSFVSKLGLVDISHYFDDDYFCEESKEGAKGAESAEGAKAVEGAEGAEGSIIY